MKKGHDGGDGYDREAELARRRARDRERRRLQKIRRTDELALLASMMFDEPEGSGDDLTVAQIVTGIETKHADVISGRRYALYCGLSKQRGAYPKTVRGEGGRFLWESKDAKANSTNIPIVQWRAHWFATRTTLSRGELQWFGFETRVVYHSRSKRKAALVEETIQGARAMVYV